MHNARDRSARVMDGRALVVEVIGVVGLQYLDAVSVAVVFCPVLHIGLRRPSGAHSGTQSTDFSTSSLS